MKTLSLARLVVGSLAFSTYTGNATELAQSEAGVAYSYRIQAPESQADLDTTLAEYARKATDLRVRTTSLSAEDAEFFRELSVLYLQAGEYESAESAIDTYVEGIRELYPNDFETQIAARMERARVLAEAGTARSAAKAYGRIRDDIEKSEGRTSLNLLPALIESAEFMRTHEIRDGLDGVDISRRLLRRAVHIAETNESATREQLAMTYLALADHYIASGTNPRKAAKYYIAAWEALDDSEEQRALREQWFDGTVPLMAAQNLPRLIEDILGRTTSPRDRSIEATFRIDTDGRAEDIAVADNVSPQMLNSAFLQYLEAIRFRPSLLDGQPADTGKHRYVLTFSGDQLPDRYR